MGYRVTFEGLDELRKLYREAPQKTIMYTQEALQEAGNELVNQTVAEIKAKKLKDRGKMMQYTRTYPTGPLQQVVEVDAEYAAAQEHGTSPFYPKIEPLKGWARRKLGNEKLAYAVAKSIARKGIKAKYFHRDAIIDSLPKIQRIFNDIFNKVYN